MNRLPRKLRALLWRVTRETEDLLPRWADELWESL